MYTFLHFWLHASFTCFLFECTHVRVQVLASAEGYWLALVLYEVGLGVGAVSHQNRESVSHQNRESLKPQFRV